MIRLFSLFVISILALSMEVHAASCFGQDGEYAQKTIKKSAFIGMVKITPKKSILLNRDYFVVEPIQTYSGSLPHQIKILRSLNPGPFERDYQTFRGLKDEIIFMDFSGYKFADICSVASLSSENWQELRKSRADSSRLKKIKNDCKKEGKFLSRRSGYYDCEW